MSYKANLDKLTIDSTGKVASSIQSDSALMANSVTPTILIVSTQTGQTISSPAVAFKGTVDYNQGFNYNSGTGLITIPSDGTYEFSGFFAVDSGGSGTDIINISLYLGNQIIKTVPLPIDTSLGEPAGIDFSFFVPGLLLNQSYFINLISYNSGTVVILGPKTLNQLVVKKIGS